MMVLHSVTKIKTQRGNKLFYAYISKPRPQFGGKHPNSHGICFSPTQKRIDKVLQFVDKHIHYIAKSIGSPPSNEMFGYFCNLHEYKS